MVKSIFFHEKSKHPFEVNLELVPIILALISPERSRLSTTNRETNKELNHKDDSRSVPTVQKRASSTSESFNSIKFDLI